ncbi:response regulator transcription factor [Pseudactinotalea sp. HY158]|uniref:response regulator transcription factor n=1 Tax=Pseudactinotalea sp. HY158 TaxID=2654547 RepID=UPI00129CADFE|nr:response regulator transcription factor [Pseudactinotalea sp. HY158]QGH69704.1 response regulator [Pseudactinotalea sp. HY158]
MRIAIAEDSAILRDGLTSLLTRRGHEVVAAVDNGTQLEAAIEARADAGTPCDVAVIDVRMPPTFTDEGLRTALRIRERHPEHGVLLFSQYVETRYATELLQGNARAIGYLLKDRVADVSEFIDALERITAGHTVLDPEVVSQLLRATPERAALERLTPREREVLEQMALGRSNSAIAAALFLSAGAVEKNISSIFAKLDLPTDDAAHRRVLAVVRYLQR